jgi:DNA-binding winged helix-turn-helix (wHTH) protein
MTDSVSPNHLRFGPFELTAEPLQLWQGTEQIALRPKSLGMLRYLAARPGQLVSKQELLERVWSGRVISQDGIRVCVREIRAALRDNAETPHYLETVVGRGYRFLEGRDGSALFPETPGPVVGRKSEQLELEGYLQRASDAARQFVLISGEPGIGKTTLLERTLDPLAKQGSATIINDHSCTVHDPKR